MSETKLLLVHRDPALLRLLGNWLDAAGYPNERVADGRQAMAAVSAACPQVVVADWESAEAGARELCKWLRQQELPSYVYFIALTERSHTADEIRTLEAGADDFLKMPVKRSELLARVRSGARVLELESRLRASVRTDALTGLVTRRTFFEFMEREWGRSVRHQAPLSCAMIDIDFFKRINDIHGHLVGDQTLKNIARLLSKNARSSDVVGRYGGEEFCVMLPETSEDDAILWGERVRRALAEEAIRNGTPETAITASFGVAQRLDDTQNPEQLVDLADQALLVAKRSGRDRVVSYRSMRVSSSVAVEAGGPGALFHGLTAKHIMATVVGTLDENDTVGRAAQYFLRFRFSSAPVTNQEGELVGVLSERDVMNIMLWPKWWLTKIKDVMKRNVVCYEECTPVLPIYEFLCRVSLRGVVIVKDRKPTGIISRAGLLRWFTNLIMVNSRAPLDMSALGATVGKQASTNSCDVRDSAVPVVRALLEESRQLDQRVQDPQAEFLPVVIGGASRIEELVNDLLAASRSAAANSPPRRANDSPGTPPPVETRTAIGVMELAESGSWPDMRGNVAVAQNR